MKKVFILMGLMLVGVTMARAEVWYILNADKEVVAKQNRQPPTAALEADNMTAVMANSDIDLTKAEFKNGKVIEHVATAKETQAKQDKAQREEELRMIAVRAQKLGYDSLKADGVNFQQITEKDFQ